VSPSAFAEGLKEIRKGTVIKPMLQAYLYDAEFPVNLTIKFKKGTQQRSPDGLFHPSEHPTWPDRMLWFYVTKPDKMQPELMRYMNTLSVTFGTAAHHFIEQCLKDMKLLLTEAELRDLGYEVHRGEPRATDDELGCIGHMDGIVRIAVPSMPKVGQHLFEFKTGNEWALGSIDDLDTDAFKKKWPGYYAQAQDYLRMTRFKMSIVLMMQMGYPWTMREFHIERSEQFIHDLDAKYRRVRLAVERNRMPDACCMPGSAQAKKCPARTVCPVGSM
jgi:hypothetical protein